MRGRSSVSGAYSRPVRVSSGELLSVGTISWAGAFLEWLDFYTYLLLAGILARHFFPSEDRIASLLAAFAAVAIGFLFRPLGALIFGKIGDQFGRKIAFLTAISIMFIATLGIGLIPGYTQIGFLASVGVFLLRILQGLALGGGYGAAIVYLGEFVPEHRRGLVTGFLFTTPSAGIATVTAIQVAITSLIGAQAYSEWGWRFNFIIAASIVFVVALAIHLLYKETPIFSLVRRLRRTTTAPIREALSNRRYLFLILLGWLGVVGAHGPIWYTNQSWNKYYMDLSGISPTLSSFILSTTTYAALWMYPLFGWISDKIGRRPVLLLGIYGNALYFILAFWLYNQYIPVAKATGDITALWLVTLGMTLFNGIGYSGAQSAFLLELFPARIRVTATAFTYNLGYGITGGLTPFMGTFLYAVTGSLYAATMIWSVAVPMIMGLFFVLKGWETKGTRIWAELSAEGFASKEPLILSPRTPVIEAARIMTRSGKRFAFAPMFEGDRRLVGVFGERRFVRALASGALLEPVEKFSEAVECVDRNSSVAEVFAVMERHRLRVAPVCSDKEIVGYVDARDLVNEILVLKAAGVKGVAVRTKAIDIASKSVVSIDAEAGLRLKDAAAIMAEKDIGFLPIISKDRRLVGIVSERDIMRAVAEKGMILDTGLLEVARTSGIVKLGTGSTARDAAEAFAKNGIRHLPIVDEGERVVAVLSIRDLFKIL